MADDYQNDTSDTTTSRHGETEPATKHDVTEGGVMGAVGGAIVGAFAGGPLGAVIGAIAGGAASAAAVDVVDKHDHDYAQTTHESRTDLNADEDDLDTRNLPVTDNDLSYGTAAPATGYGTTDTRAYGTGAIDTAVYNPAESATAASTMDQDDTRLRGSADQVVVPVVEEELAVGKREVQRGGAHVSTNVIETPVEQQVTLRNETVNVDRRPVNRAVTDADRPFQGGVVEVEEIDEVAVVTKDARVVEEVIIGKTAQEHTETVRDTVRRTDVQVEQLDDAQTKRNRNDY